MMVSGEASPCRARVLRVQPQREKVAAGSPARAGNPRSARRRRPPVHSLEGRQRHGGVRTASGGGNHGRPQAPRRPRDRREEHVHRESLHPGVRGVPGRLPGSAASPRPRGGPVPAGRDGSLRCRGARDTGGAGQALAALRPGVRPGGARPPRGRARGRAGGHLPGPGGLRPVGQGEQAHPAPRPQRLGQVLHRLRPDPRHRGLLAPARGGTLPVPLGLPQRAAPQGRRAGFRLARGERGRSRLLRPPRRRDAGCAALLPDEGPPPPAPPAGGAPAPAGGALPPGLARGGGGGRFRPLRFAHRGRSLPLLPAHSRRAPGRVSRRLAEGAAPRPGGALLRLGSLPAGRRHHRATALGGRRIPPGHRRQEPGRASPGPATPSPCSSRTGRWSRPTAG